MFIHAQDRQEKSEAAIELKINKIQKKLKSLKNKLNKAYGKEQELMAQLEQQDRVISSIAKQVENSNQQINAIQFKIKQLLTQIENSAKSIEIQTQQILKLLKIQVYMSHDKTLKMLLAHSKNAATVQTKHQIKYLQNRLYNLIKEVAEKIQKLEILKQDQESLKADESNKKEELERHQKSLMQQRNQRLKLLNQLKKEIAKHETESESLGNDQKRLRQLLVEIQVLLSDLPEDLGSNKSFRKLQGRMKKPVVGQYIHSFHSRRSGNTKWDGVVIQANMGDKVHAIAYGRVAFADWLRGFGMLVILDHQDGYMSLYGFNESLTVEVGDWVDGRQPIATIGNSGTLIAPAVYFEIRKDAIPLNPKLWVK